MRTFAGVARGRRQPTRGDARGSVGAAVWLDQAGVAHILAELAGPPRRANTLGEKQESDMCLFSNIQIVSDTNYRGFLFMK